MRSAPVAAPSPLGVAQSSGDGTDGGRLQELMLESSSDESIADEGKEDASKRDSGNEGD